MTNEPNLILLAGPNGAGKTTASARVLTGKLAVQEFVNADIIAEGISRSHPESVAIQAGRIMLNRLNELTGQRVNVAFESTLASRTFVPMIGDLAREGYRFHLLFLWLPSADMAINRVRQRVANGGHNIPEEVARRRYEAGLRNFFQLYASLAASWSFYDSSFPGSPRLLAEGSFGRAELVRDTDLWNKYSNGTKMTTEASQAIRAHALTARALHEAFMDAIAKHISLHAPMVFWEDGKVVHYAPERLRALRETTLQEYREKYREEYTG